MNVLHLVPLISPNADYGGPARGTLRQAAFTTELGEHVTVASLWPRHASEPKPTSMLGVPLVLFDVSFRVPGHKFVGMWSWGMIAWIFRNARRADVVHIHAGREWWIACSALLLRVLGVRYVWQSHGMLAPSKNPLAVCLDRLILRSALRRAEFVYHLTPVEEAQLRSLYGLTNLRQLINGVDNIVGVEESPGYDGEGPLKVIVTSRLHRRKRIPELVESVVTCVRGGLNVQLAIYGPDEGDLTAITEAISQGEASAYVTYGGSLPYNGVRSELGRHHVIALTSVDEPFPNSVLEGMAQGLVPLISRSCGLAPYVESADAGAVVDDEDYLQIRAHLHELATEPELFTRLQKASIELTRATFSMERVAIDLRESYRCAYRVRTS